MLADASCVLLTGTDSAQSIEINKQDQEIALFTLV